MSQGRHLDMAVHTAPRKSSTSMTGVRGLRPDAGYGSNDQSEGIHALLDTAPDETDLDESRCP